MSKAITHSHGCEINLAPDIKMLPPANIAEHSGKIMQGLRSALELVVGYPDSEWPINKKVGSSEKCVPEEWELK